MSTSDLPGELRGPLGQVSPSGPVPIVGIGPTPSLAAGSPGIGASGASVPGPTLPDADPAALAVLMQRMANELFGGVPGVAVPAATPAAVASTPAMGGGAPTADLAVAPSLSPSLPGAMPSFALPVEPTSPFGAAPSFAQLGSFDADLPFADVRLPFLSDPGEVPSPAPPDAPTPVMPGYEHVATDDVLVRQLGGGAFDPYAVRREFPILDQEVHGKRLIWLDNAATTQKPSAVIERLKRFYEHENSNVHRAAHTLAARATDAYEAARETVRRFLGASSNREIIWVRGATEGINLVAKSWGARNVGPGDEIVVTHLEHHANIVPWQMLCADKGARLRVAPVDHRGDVILEEYEKLLGPKTKLVAFTQVSNALGTITPAKEMVEMAHRHGARVLVDGAQAVSHMPVDVQQLDCDFYVFSGHKVFAPTGIGVVYGKPEVLADMPPWQGGGNMIEDVTFERTVYQGPPARFEAGTGNIADAVGLGAALDWLTRLGLPNVARHEHDLLEYGTARLRTVPGLTLIGTSPHKAGVLSFVLDGFRTEDVGGALDEEGIAVRSGHHCAQPILRRFGLEATVRASLAPYNVCEDLDALVEALLRLQAGRG